jgi:HK97 family phage prohead protease
MTLREILRARRNYNPDQPRDPGGENGGQWTSSFLHHEVVDLTSINALAGFSLDHSGDVTFSLDFDDDESHEIEMSADGSAELLDIMRGAIAAHKSADFPADGLVYSREVDNGHIAGAADLSVTIDSVGDVLITFEPADADEVVEFEIGIDELRDLADALQGVEDVAETVDLRSRKEGKAARRYSPATVRARAEAPPAIAPAGELDVVRDIPRVAELRADAGKADDVLGTVFGHFSVFDAWYPIRSWWEGDFVERIAPGAFAKTMRERRSSIVTAFDHGFDPQIGDKVLGPIDQLREDKTGAYYEIGLLDTSYNRDLMPGLKRGLYGASFRFAVVKDEWNQEPEASDYNPDKLPERTIRELRLYEFGPVTYPASPAATSAMRSGTDTYYERLARRDPERVGALRSLRNARTSTARPAVEAAQNDLVEPLSQHSAGMSARDRRERLYPTLKGA